MWTGEANSADGFTPLALAAMASDRLRLGTAVVPVYTRGPGLLAMQAATMAELAPGRFALGVGSSSDVIVERWNAIPFTEPYKRVRDTVRFLRLALTGEKVDAEYETFRSTVSVWDEHPSRTPPIYVGRPTAGHAPTGGARGRRGHLELAVGRGRRRRPWPRSGRARRSWPGSSSVPPRTPTGPARRRIGIAAYLNVAVYAAFHRWLGRGPLLEEMWARVAIGDRKAALAAIPDEVVDALVVHGSPEECRAHVQRYVDNGVTVPVGAPSRRRQPLQGGREPGTVPTDARAAGAGCSAAQTSGERTAERAVSIRGGGTVPGGGQSGRKDAPGRRAPFPTPGPIRARTRSANPGTANTAGRCSARPKGGVKARLVTGAGAWR